MFELELELKQQVSQLLSNQMLVSLLRDKRYNIDQRTYIELEGDFNFTLSYVNDRLILTCNSVKPKVVAKRFLKFVTRLSSISIGKDDIIFGLDGAPDLTAKLV